MGCALRDAPQEQEEGQQQEQPQGISFLVKAAGALEKRMCKSRSGSTGLLIPCVNKPIGWWVARFFSLLLKCRILCLQNVRGLRDFAFLLEYRSR